MGAESYNAVTELLDRNADEGRADKVAFIDRQRRLTYGALQADTRRVANYLMKLGVRREERVALILLDTVDFPVVFLGAIRAGVVPVALNTLLSADQYAYMLGDSRARVLFISAPLLKGLEPILPKLADLHTVVVVGEGAPSSHMSLAQALADMPATFETAPTHPDEPAFWLYSSGSTGRPKGVKHVHTSLMETARLYGQGVLGIREDDVVFSAAKLYFAYGLGNALTFPMSVGATAVLLDERPAPAAVLDHLLRRANRLRRRARRPGVRRRDRVAASAPVRLCRRGPARAPRPELEGALWRRHPRRDRLDRDASHLRLERTG
jgi:4-hydroxybenzoate-CoA ligase